MMQPMQTQSLRGERQKRLPTRITVTLPPGDYDAVVRLSRVKRVSASWVVRDAVSSYVAAGATPNSLLPNEGLK
jgi:hypothetical protein